MPHLTPARTMAPDAPDSEWLLLVDFKWVMAGIGWWVDLSRWQHDELYARGCLARALESNNEVLRRLARDIAERQGGRVLGATPVV